MKANKMNWTELNWMNWTELIHCEDFLPCLVSQSRGKIFSQRNVFPAGSACKRDREVLSHWMGDLGTGQDVSFTLGHVIQLVFSCHTVQQFCSFFVWKTAHLIRGYQVVSPKSRATSFGHPTSFCIVVQQTKCIQCMRNVVPLVLPACEISCPPGE